MYICWSFAVCRSNMSTENAKLKNYAKTAPILTTIDTNTKLSKKKLYKMNKKM